jgi:arylsulfatase A-like enzyme
MLAGCQRPAPSGPAFAAASQPPQEQPERPAERPTDQASDPGQPAPKDAPAAAPVAGPEPAPVIVRYDLAAHPERAELRRGRVQLVDFGEPGGAKYTLGGWMTGAGDDRVLDGTSALVVPGKVVKLLLPADEGGAARVVMRVRGMRPGPLTVHLNGETLANLKLSGDGFERFELPLDGENAGLLKGGENLLQLRVHRTGSAPGAARAGLAIDWVELAPAGSEPSKDGPPSAAILADGEPGASRLRVPAGHALGYALEVPPGGRLRAAVSSDGGSLKVVARRDGAPDEPLGELRGQAALDVDLGKLSGEVVRLDLLAEDADVVLRHPAVVTPAPETDATGAQAAPIENVVVVLIDTLRADKLSPYRADTRVETPGLAEVLKSAAVMDNARTQENWTKPSVATLLSSLLPWEHKAVTGDARVPRSVELLPELLRKRGFYTGSFIANGYVSDKFGFKQGWHTYRNYIREGRRTKAQYVAADVLDWLDERPKDKPFFLYMHTIDPHVPYRPPQHFVSMYDDDAYGGVVNFSKTSALLEKIKVGSINLNRRDKRHLEALYDAEISYHDVHFAAVMKGLEKRGLADETMVVITSDHGEEFWDHGSVGHGHSVYDELLHIPMIVRLPGVTEGKPRVPAAVGLVDVMPTILDALGQEIPEELSGRSFLPELRGETATAPRSAVAGFMTGWRTLAVGKLKLIQRTLHRPRLYDVSRDPGETQDVAESHPIAVRYARGLLGLSLADATTSGGAPRAQHGGRARPKKKQHRSEKTDIDEKTRKQLEALGYIGTSAK